MADGSVYKWLIVISGLMLLFNMAGLQTFTGAVIGEFSGNFQNFKLSNFFDTIQDVVLLGAVAGTIVVGLLFRRSPESALLVPYATLLLAFSADLVMIYQTAQQSEAWIGQIASLLLIPIAVGYAHSVVSWWGQR